MRSFAIEEPSSPVPALYATLHVFMSMYQDVPMENVEEVELVEGAIQGQEEEEEG